jgi:hypothetical protein
VVQSDHHECWFHDEHLGRKLQLGDGKTIAKERQDDHMVNDFIFRDLNAVAKVTSCSKLNRCGISRGSRVF